MTIDKSPRATASSSSGSYGHCSAGATCVPVDKRLRDLVRLRLLTRRTQGNTKADAVVFAGSPWRCADRQVPATSYQHPPRSAPDDGPSYR